MNDKPIAALLAAIAVAPICIVCVLGPAVVGGLFASWFGWFADLTLGQIAVLGLVVAMIAFGGVKMWRMRRVDRDPGSFGNIR